MRDSYTVKWRRINDYFWTTITDVVGHNPERLVYSKTKSVNDNNESSSRVQEYEEVTNYDRMVFHLKNGGVRTVSKWSECELYLGEDWAECKREKAELSKSKNI